MGSKREVVYLSELKDIQILWPGDIRSLAEFKLRCCDSEDKIANSNSRGGIQKSRPTIHGLAADFEHMTNISISRIERILKDYGFNLGATIEFDVLKLVSSIC
ncbi:MAG: hypothetical protein JW787_14355 [Sedimentisphaerales bacterium]|nr:hypothetical protein [Sedimentisphaerales bacterium]